MNRTNNSLNIKNLININQLENSNDNIKTLNEIYYSIKSHKNINNLSQNTIIKNIIYNIIRHNDININNYGILILVGIKNVSEAHLSLTVNELSDILLNQSNETKSNDKMNIALSTIMDTLPKDIKEQLIPNDKTELLNIFKQSGVVKEGFTNLGKYNSLNSIFSNDTLGYNQRRAKIDKLLGSHNNSDNGYKPDHVTMGLNNESYNNSLEDYYEKYGKEAEPLEPILASYINDEPEIVKGKDGKLYHYDIYSGSLQELKTKDAAKNDKMLKLLLKTHKITDKEAQRVFKDYKANENNNANDIDNKEKINQIINNYKQEKDEGTTKIVYIILGSIIGFLLLVIILLTIFR